MSWMVVPYTHHNHPICETPQFFAPEDCISPPSDMASSVRQLISLVARGVERRVSSGTIEVLVRLTAPSEQEETLQEAKSMFADAAVTKAVVDHMKFLIEQDTPLTLDQCDSINNCLLLLTNILHIQEIRFNSGNTHSSVQNQIIWNLFTQSIDKVIIYLVSCPQKIYWSVTLVQLISLMYKDQHVGTLQKLLNLWLEASFSESSDDNESNTSPPDQRSDESSPVITSDPTSDSSDNGIEKLKNMSLGKDIRFSTIKHTTSLDNSRCVQSRHKMLSNMKRNKSTETETSASSSGVSSMGHSLESCENDKHEVENTIPACLPRLTATISTLNKNSLDAGKKKDCFSIQSEISDCGYVTQVENQESISTSSNDDDQPRPVHQKPHNQKSRFNPGKNKSTMDKKELRRKKLVKRSKTNSIKMKGLPHHQPTDDDVAVLLKEFTVDFLLKGYGTLVRDLHAHLLASIHSQVDASHFFWLVTYFIQFGAQLELDMEHVSPVLSYDILAYLIFQGVWLSEELELSCRVVNVDLKPCLRRLHLVVTAIREFIQGVETYLKMIHLSDDDRRYLQNLQDRIRETEELKLLFIMLLRQYNPVIQSKQYLQDLILSNHNFLLFMDNVSQTADEHLKMVDHLREFATVEIVKQYGILLEDFKENGEYINNCIFTMMHHIAGDLKNVPTLFQPVILKTFSKIFETDYEICDDWSDLIEYVIHKFINTPRNSSSPEITALAHEDFAEESPPSVEAQQSQSEYNSVDELSLSFRWTPEEKENLLGYYNQSRNSLDLIANITQKYEENGMRSKSQLSIIKELLDQGIITENQYIDFMKTKTTFEMRYEDVSQIAHCDLYEKEMLAEGDVKVLKEYLYKENKTKSIKWLQRILLESCYVKLALGKPHDFQNNEVIMEPTIYYYVLLNLPIPIVPWTTEQNEFLKHQPLILLLHKLGFHLPANTGRVFIRIPNFWHAGYMFLVAQQLGPIDQATLKFDTDKLDVKSCEPFFAKSHPVARFNDYEKFSTIYPREAPSVVRFTPLPYSNEGHPVSHRVAVTNIDVANSGHGASSANKTFSTPMDFCQQDHVSTCDTASVTSDLTRMCVSDEDEKPTEVIQKK